MTSDRRQLVIDVLRDEGVDSEGGPHSWRCFDKERYPGPCGCVEAIADLILDALSVVAVSADTKPTAETPRFDAAYQSAQDDGFPGSREEFAEFLCEHIESSEAEVPAATEPLCKWCKQPLEVHTKPCLPVAAEVPEAHEWTSDSRHGPHYDATCRRCNALRPVATCEDRWLR